mmetsp:Transcript_7389/g.18797  ORF Transcript_7389/g.18797 Transcript_7389/m.18797 type:complete len:268 (+) Transcript_7389:486-1289(+)
MVAVVECWQFSRCYFLLGGVGGGRRLARGEHLLERRVVPELLLGELVLHAALGAHHVQAARDGALALQVGRLDLGLDLAVLFVNAAPRVEEGQEAGLVDRAAAQRLVEHQVVVQVQVPGPVVLGVKFRHLLVDVLLQKTHQVAASRVDRGLGVVQLGCFRTAEHSAGAPQHQHHGGAGGPQRRRLDGGGGDRGGRGDSGAGDARPHLSGQPREGGAGEVRQTGRHTQRRASSHFRRRRNSGGGDRYAPDTERGQSPEGGGGSAAAHR